MPTLSPNMVVVKDFVEARWGSQLTHIGVYNCRRISGSQTYSQHSWPNAIDIHVTQNYYATPGQKAVGDAIHQALKDEFGDHIYENIWWTTSHWNHLHVSTYPKGWLTPPCDGGAQRIKYRDGSVKYAPFPLTITKEDDTLQFIIDTLKTQNMAFYRSLQAKTGTPGGNPDYWGSDYAGSKPSQSEWEAAAMTLFAAALQAGVFAEVGAVDAHARSQADKALNKLAAAKAAL